MKMDWQDLALFLAIADAGGLARAAQVTGKSQATLGRHMTRLESYMDKRLFQRGAAGYALTAEGRALVPLARDMRRNADAIDRWVTQDNAARRVRISAGMWTATWLAHRFSAFWKPDAPWVPEFVTSTAHLDIARREVDIGIRNARPTQTWLAGKRTRKTRFAAYGLNDTATGWIAISGDTASARWLMANHGNDIVTTANDSRIAAGLAAAGLGRVVLPTFTQDLPLGLIRLSDPIQALDSHQWLVSHHQGRHDPPIRAALNALTRLLCDPPASAP